MRDLHCAFCGRDYPGDGADMYCCPKNNSGHCSFVAKKYGQSRFADLARFKSGSSHFKLPEPPKDPLENIKKITEGFSTLSSFEDLNIQSEARRKAKFDFYYGKEMAKLQEEWIEKQKNLSSEEWEKEYYCSFKAEEEKPKSSLAKYAGNPGSHRTGTVISQRGSVSKKRRVNNAGWKKYLRDEKDAQKKK